MFLMVLRKDITAPTGRLFGCPAMMDSLMAKAALVMTLLPSMSNTGFGMLRLGLAEIEGTFVFPQFVKGVAQVP